MKKDDGFARRLAKACDDNPLVPALHHGRQAWVSRELSTSKEGVRKWFAGEGRPRVRTMEKLAKVLHVDLAWLALGTEQTPTSRGDVGRFAREEQAVVHLAFGMSMLSGATCARPADNDPRKEYVDYYMILHGSQVAVRTTTAHEAGDDLEFILPQQYKDVHIVGFVHKGAARVHMLDMPTDLIDKHKAARGDGYVVKVKVKDGKYVSSRDVWPRLMSLSELVNVT